MIGTIMLANRYGLVARLHRRRPRTVRDAGRQRQRRAPVRPARAGRLRAARPPGPAPAPGPPRPADRAGQPRAVQPARARGARGRLRGQGRGDVHRPRRLQGRQRHARARDRRRAAARRRVAARALGPPRRRRRAPRRRRVRRARASATRMPSRAPSSIAERTLQAFLMPVAAGEKPLNVSLSIGIAASHSARTHAEELLRDADVAMYEAKEGGKRRFAVFTPAMRDSIVRRHDLKEELERAIEVPRADRPVPADRRPRDRRDDRGRGARALEPSGPRPHPPGRVHPARRGHRPDRPARALRARGGVHAGRRALPRPAACRSTCPRSSSSTRT